MKIGFTLFSCKSDLASPGKYPCFTGEKILLREGNILASFGGEV